MLVALMCAFQSQFAIAEPADYPATSLQPRSQYGWDRTPNQIDESAPPDEAQRGMTEAGTPVQMRDEGAFPAEGRNLFVDLDSVPGAAGEPVPFSYDSDAQNSEEAHKAVRGKNTWLLWGEGNEVFWNWVQQHGYGLTDFLLLLDSRTRNTRFARTGLINEPHMLSQTDRSKRILGLYLDQMESTTKPAGANAYYPQPELFPLGDRAVYQDVLDRLAKDALNPAVYGYPSGIVGLRLFLNPDFFGNTIAAATARQYWHDKVEVSETDAFYDVNQWVSKDPKLVRPFRVAMSCGFCHVSPHPLFPPKDPEHPEWQNLSSTIGDQYWRPVATFTNLQVKGSFLYQFLASQQPGTIDTSLVSTDHINNSNTITAIFDLPARLVRAGANVPEDQNAPNLLIPQIEDPVAGTNPRHTPRVLLDGADSVGVFGALSRVYLNIGAYSEEWKRLHNTVVGFTPQRPFAVSTAVKNSAYWRAADKYRIPYLASFFTYRSQYSGQSVTQPMHLADVPAGRVIIDAEKDNALKGRAVFIQNCAICHSSKQPQGLKLLFARNWSPFETLEHGAPPILTLPMAFKDWRAFTKTKAYLEYVRQIGDLAGQRTGTEDRFLQDNFLSNEIRIPITLVGTNSGRAVGTNAMRGQIWDNFSSETYKTLPAVGPVNFFNPFSKVPTDEWGNNDSYAPPGNGPGYYRPASLISLWATAPYLHNNALGAFTGDPSIEGRLKAFNDGIDKILWREKRQGNSLLAGDLRGTMAAANGDSGFIYRTTVPSYIEFAPGFIRPLIQGVLGSFWTSFLTSYVWWGLAAIFVGFAIFGGTRQAGFFFALVAVAIAVLLRLSRIDTVYPLLWLLPAISAIATFAFWVLVRHRIVSRLVFLVLVGASLFTSYKVTSFVDGDSGSLRIGPIPEGTPVNLLMNTNPEAPVTYLAAAGFGIARGLLRIRRDSLEGEAAWTAFRDEAAGPLMRVSKCPDFVLDRGHWFAQDLRDDEKVQLKAFLKTL
ncbi:hypothetical protein [Rhizobium ruizarguesonis]